VAGRALPLIAALLGSTAACVPKQPMPIALQDTWSDAERARLLRDMQRWEEATNHLVRFLPSPAPFHDATGEFERADLDDGVNVLYKIERPNADTDALMAATGEQLLGYNFSTDVLIFHYKVAFAFWSDSGEELDSVVLHELGHHLGLGHNRLHPAVMNDLLTGEITCITRWDIEAFCQVYGCLPSDLHPECADGP